MLVILVAQWHTWSLDGLRGPEGRGTVLTSSSDLLVDRVRVAVQAVFRIGKLTHPRGPGTIGDQSDLVIRDGNPAHVLCLSCRFWVG